MCAMMIILPSSTCCPPKKLSKHERTHASTKNPFAFALNNYCIQPHILTAYPFACAGMPVRIPECFAYARIHHPMTFPPHMSNECPLTAAAAACHNLHMHAKNPSWQLDRHSEFAFSRLPARRVLRMCRGWYQTYAHLLQFGSLDMLMTKIYTSLLPLCENEGRISMLSRTYLFKS